MDARAICFVQDRRSAMACWTTRRTTLTRMTAGRLRSQCDSATTATTTTAKVSPTPQAARRSALTAVEGAKLVARLFRILHALQERRHTGIVLAPEVVCDCSSRVWLVTQGTEHPCAICRQEKKEGSARVGSPGINHDDGGGDGIQDRATAGASDEVAGMLRLTEQERSRGCHKVSLSLSLSSLSLHRQR